MPIIQIYVDDKQYVKYVKCTDTEKSTRKDKAKQILCN